MVTTKAIELRRGDSSDFNGNQILFIISNPDGIDLTGWKARFELGNFTKDWNDITFLNLELIISKEETVCFNTGLQYGSFKLVDTNNRTQTTLSGIAFFVLDQTVSNAGIGSTISSNSGGEVVSSIDVPIPSITSTSISVELSTGGTLDHNKLINRDLSEQHPISAITDLQPTLAGLQTQIDEIETGEGDFLTKEEAANTYLALVSTDRQILSSNLTIKNGNKLLLEKKNGADGAGIFMGEYDDGNGGIYEQVEIGTESDPLCLNHSAISPTDNLVVGKNIIVNYKDENGMEHADNVAYISDVKITYISSERNAIIPDTGQNYFTVPAGSSYVNIPVESVNEFNNRNNIAASLIGEVDTTLNILKFNENATDYFDEVKPSANIRLDPGAWSKARVRVIIAQPTATLEQMTALSEYEGGNGSFEAGGGIVLSSYTFEDNTEARAVNLSPIPIWAEINNNGVVTSRNGYYLALQVLADGADVRVSTSTDLEFNSYGYNKNPL